jgi:hypothetical protein
VFGTAIGCEPLAARHYTLLCVSIVPVSSHVAEVVNLCDLQIGFLWASAHAVGPERAVDDVAVANPLLAFALAISAFFADCSALGREAVPLAPLRRRRASRFKRSCFVFLTYLVFCGVCTFLMRLPPIRAQWWFPVHCLAS